MTQGPNPTATPTPPTAPAYPLAPEQRGLWYEQQVLPDCGAYHLLFGAHATLAPTLDGPALDALLPALLPGLLQRHPVLRTGLALADGVPVQQVHDKVLPDLRTTDATRWSEQALRSQARADSRLPFDLCQPPLWRVHLYRRAPAEWLVVVVVHHLLLDFWSLGLLLQEAGSQLGLCMPGPALDGSGYRLHALRQHARLQDPRITAPWLQYWQSQLQAAPPVHGLPLDQARPAVRDADGRSIAFALTAAASDAVRQCARAAGATPFVVLLATYFALLQRFSGDDDLVVAVPVAGRTRRDQRLQLGQFVNTVALRAQPDQAQSFEALVEQVRLQVSGAVHHQECPYAWLIGELAPPRHAGHQPIAQLAFAWERLPHLAGFADFFLPDPPATVRPGNGIVLRPFALPQQEGQYELQLEMGGERDGAFVGSFKYRHSLFGASTVTEMAACFGRLVEALATNPALPVGAARMDSDAARIRWLAWGQGAACRWRGPGTTDDSHDDPAESVSVLADIALRVERQPDAPAVRDAASALSYRALWTRAGRMAAALQARGVGTGDRVGLMLGRTFDLVAGLLAIWRAGAAYVPLDPSLPAERLARMADDAGLSAVLTSSAQVAQAATDASGMHETANASDASDARSRLARLPTVDVDHLGDAAQVPAPRHADVAYLIYTSGSTGVPKGVQVGHRSVRNFLLGMQQLLRWDAGTRLLAVTTPAFDISVLELLLPLVAGGEVVVADHEAVRDGRRLATWLEQGITAMQATPATWSMLVDAGWKGQPRLTALCGGDTLAEGLAEKLQARCSALWNLYGPTETTVWSTAALVVRGEPVHLGSPLANTQLYVLDAQGRPVPPGTRGELWIGGDGLAMGYWRQPDLTDARFRTLDTLPGAGRLYRTGDIVRRTRQGLLEHHGRQDFQIKLRGFRIEPGEIEAVLARQPGVQECVVVLCQPASPQARLVAYLVPGAGTPTTDVLRDALRAALPRYMVPSAFVVLAAMPRTPGGKIDRKALPPPPSAALPTASLDALPHDAAEIQLAGIFSDLLELPQVGVDDDFFDAGGDSLSAVRLATEVETRFGIDLPMAEVVRHPTVRLLAQRLRQTGRSPATPLLTLRHGPPAAPLWLFHPIGGTVFCYVELARQLAPGRAVHAFQAAGIDDADAADISVEAMAQRYLALLRATQPHGPYLLGGWCFGGVVAFEVARRLRDSGEPVEGVVLIDTRAPVPANVPADADDATLLSWFARDLAAPLGRTLAIDPATLRGQAPEAMFAHVLGAARAAGVLPPDADAERLAHHFAVYAGNGIALRTYFPPREDLPLLLLRAADEPHDHGSSLGWQALAGAGLRIVDVPGDHTSMLQGSHAQAVARAIDRHYPCARSVLAVEAVA